MNWVNMLTLHLNQAGVGTATSLVKLEESACSRGHMYVSPLRKMIGEIDLLINSRPKANIALIKALIRRSQ